MNEKDCAIKTKMADCALAFFDLPRQDIIFDKIFTYLYMDEIYKCRRVSKAFKILSDKFFQNCSVFDISNISQKIALSSNLVERLTKYNSSLHTLILRTPTFLLEDSVVVDVFRRNPNLKKLDLSGCRMLTSVVILKLAAFCSQLLELILFDCIWVSPKALIDVFQSCHDLEKIDLTRCLRVDADCMTSLSHNCPKLKSLRMNQIIGLLDQDLEQIATHCTSLIHVGLGGCVMLTDSCLSTLVSKCRNLKYVEVNSCNSMTRNGLQFLWDNHIETDVKKEFVERSKFWS